MQELIRTGATGSHTDSAGTTLPPEPCPKEGHVRHSCTPRMATGATSASVPAASKPGGEGQCSGMVCPAPAASHGHPCRAWAISSAQHTTLGEAEAASWRRPPSLNSKSTSERDTLVNNFKGLFKLQLATAFICLLLCCTFLL